MSTALQNLSLSLCPVISLCTFAAFLYSVNQNGHMSREIMAGVGGCPPPYTVSLPFPRSITCKDLVFRAHYFLLSSHTLSKAMVSLVRLESWGLSGKQGYSDHLG